MIIKVQSEDFSPADEIDALTAGRTDVGAVVSFVGLVRDNDAGDLKRMVLEHYPGMTDKQLAAIAAKARSRWKLQDILVIHRYGELAPGDRIVLVATLSAHRGDAFAAAEYVMDWLKTKAPFWKREETGRGAQWVEARSEDDRRANRWAQGSD